jgi:hypothetical protein
MPTTTYMVVDPRRDRSFRVPRPDLSVALGTPNACSGCHTLVRLKRTPDAARELARDAGDPAAAARHAKRMAERGAVQMRN